MKQSSGIWLIAAFVSCFLAVGIPCWMIPYSDVSANLPSALLGPSLWVVALAALLLRACSIASFRRTTVIIGMSVPAAVFARVVAEGMADPTSHNLWPFEIGIAVFVGFPCAFAGAVLGLLAAKMMPDRGHFDLS